MIFVAESVEDAASVDTLMSFSAQGGGIILQGDDMTHRRTGESLLSELTGLEFVTNGTRTCNVRTNNQLGAQYRVEVQDQYHPLVRSSLGTSFLYGDDIDHSIPMNVGEKVLAWATLDGDANCEVRVPAIVAWDPSQLNHHSNLLLSAKNQSRLGTDSTLLKDGDVVHYKQETDEAHILLTEDIFRTANGEMGSNEEIDALHYIPSNGHYLLSTRAHAYLGQPLVAIRPGDIVEYDPVQDQAQIIFSQDLFRKANGEPANAANVDALFQSDSNTLYLSTKHIERLGVGEEMLTFKKGDVVRYDISQDQASLFISADDLFRRNNGESGGTGDIDALHVISDHKIVFSSLAAEFVGLNHLAVKDGDLVIYDITTQQASLYMSESVFRKANGQQGAQADIDAITLTSFISP